MSLSCSHIGSYLFITCAKKRYLSADGKCIDRIYKVQIEEEIHTPLFIEPDFELGDIGRMQDRCLKTRALASDNIVFTHRI